MESELQKPATSRTALIALVMLALGGALGFAAGMTVARPAGDTGDKQGAYAEGFADAKKKVEEAGLIVPDPESLTSLSGAVAAIGAGSFTMTVSARSFSPFATDIPLTREVLIDAKTVVATRVPKDPEKFRAEFEAYQKKYQSPESDGPQAGSVPPPPEAFDLKKLTLKDLKKGDVVSVVAASDIKSAPSFTAVTVYVTTPDALPAIAPVPVPPVPANPTP